MYFKLVNDIEFDSPFVINEPEGLPVEFDLMSGEEIKVSVKTPIVYTTNAKKGDRLRDFLHSDYMLMSGKFLDLVKKSGVDNLQIFPAIIKSTEDGHVRENFFGVNILGLVSCADLSKSRYDEMMSGYYCFDELAIDVNKIPQGLLMFRLKEHAPTVIIHHDIGQYIYANDQEDDLAGWSVDEIIQ